MSPQNLTENLKINNCIFFVKGNLEQMSFRLINLETNDFHISFEQICSTVFNYGVELSPCLLKYVFVKLIIKL